ncbi:MAG: High-affinity zinc uptake system ATP-binding protein ZnuC [Bacteroidota bacterium]|jgi:ABC-type Mn2+/Zn2+ transport system ATPase subunit
MSNISIKGLSVSYDKKLALTNIFLEMSGGNIYGVLGPNGAGKSTLFKAILGLIPTGTGQILINGQPIQKQRKTIAYVPQKDDVDWQFPATVMDVVLMGRYPHKKLFQKLGNNDRLAALDAMRRLGIEHLQDKQIGELSGGQQQRVFLARALCQEASILMLDEPFTGVDLTTEENIIALLKSLAANGKMLLVVHHDLSSVPYYFDQVVLVNQRLVAVGKTTETFTQENIAKTFGGQLPVLHLTGLV